MRVHGIKTRKHKINPNLTCEKQTKKRTMKHRLIHTKEDQNKSIFMQGNKKQN